MKFLHIFVVDEVFLNHAVVIVKSRKKKDFLSCRTLTHNMNPRLQYNLVAQTVLCESIINELKQL